MSHTRLEVVVPATRVYCKFVQVAMDLHWVVPASFWKELTPSQVLHCRSDDCVGATLCTVPGLQVVMRRQVV